MTPSAWTRLDGVARNLSPFALTLLLIMAGMVPLRVPDMSPIIPALGLIAVYYWVVYRPDLMPAWAVFLVGLITDLLSGAPLGVTVFVFLAVAAAVGAQRRVFASGSFALVWAIFILIAAGAFLLKWLLTGLILGVLLRPGPAVFQYLTTIAFYPCVAWVFAQAQRAFLR